MAFNARQLRALIAEILENESHAQGHSHAFASKAAVELLLGTCAVESNFGTYLRQIRGPACGIFQMEPATFHWIAGKYGFEDRAPSDLMWDLRLAILTARYRYWTVPEPIPPADNTEGLAAYWKQHYNTHYGSGKPADFIRKYLKYVKGE